MALLLLFHSLCDPVDCSPPGSSVHGISQTRVLEWVAISFSNAWKWKVKGKSLSLVRLLATPWTAAYQSRRKYKWNMNLCLHLKMTHSKIEFWSIFQMKERSMVSSPVFVIDIFPFDGVWALRRKSEENWVGKLRTPDEKSNFADFSLGTISPKLIPGFKCSEGWGAFSVSFQCHQVLETLFWVFKKVMKITLTFTCKISTRS